jgi:hypothetical protein
LRASRRPGVSHSLEKHLAITEHVGVGRSSGAVFLEEILEHLIAILPGEVSVVQRNIELFAHAASVLEVLGGGAIAIIVLPVGHVQGMDVVAFIFQEQGGNGRIHAA